MRARHTITAAVLVIAFAVLGGFALSWRNDSLHREGVIRTAVDAYIYGYPLELAQRDKLIANPDGSTDLYVQADSPGADKEANWLPAPKGKFVLVMRIYQPRTSPPSIIDGSWTPPPARKAP